MKKILLFIFLIIFLIPNAYANTCTTEEVRRLTELANRVKVNYDVGKIFVDNLAANEGGPEKLEVDNFYLTIYNLTEDLFLIATNNQNNEKITINFNDFKDGKFSLDTRNNLYEITEYTFKIYAQKDTCKFRELKTIKYTKPITNQLYFYDSCQKNLDIPICQQYITKEINVNFLELDEYIEKYKKNSIGVITTKKTVDEKSFIHNYIYYILGFGVVAFGLVVFLIIKKRREL